MLTIETLCCALQNFIFFINRRIFVSWASVNQVIFVPFFKLPLLSHKSMTFIKFLLILWVIHFLPFAHLPFRCRSYDLLRVIKKKHKHKKLCVVRKKIAHLELRGCVYLMCLSVVLFPYDRDCRKRFSL